MKLLMLNLTLAATVFSDAAMAERIRDFGTPSINGRYVDACTHEYGADNCSTWGKQEAARAFCRYKGYDGVYGSWMTQHQGEGDHHTFRWTIKRRNGREVSQFEYCAPCSYIITDISCVSY